MNRRSRILGSVLIALSIMLNTLVPCLCAGPETGNGDLVCAVAVRQRADITPYFESYLDIRQYRIDPNSKKIASVTKTGILKGKKAGTAIVRAYNSSGAEIANRKIRVEKPCLRLPFINDLSTTCNAGEYLIGPQDDPVLTITPTNYSSSKPKVAVIDSKTGVITMRKKGTTKITAYYGEGKNAAKVSCTLKIKTGKPDMQDYYVDMGNGDKKKVRGYFDDAMAKSLYDLINDYRDQYDDSEVSRFASDYTSPTNSQNALNLVAQVRALESAVYFSHIRPSERSYYTAFNEDVPKQYLTGKYSGEDLIGGKQYDSAASVLYAIKTHDDSHMASKYFDGMGVAVFVTSKKTKLENGIKQNLKYHIVIDYIGPEKPKQD